MSLAETQAALARLFTCAEAREVFARDPFAAALAAGLDGDEASGFAQMAPAEVARFAAALLAKRRLDVAKWLPLTAAALGQSFGPLLRESLAEPPPGARADALAFVARLAGAPAPPWIGELADYESRFLRAWGPRAHLALRCYRWPVPRLAALLAAGEAIGRNAPAPTFCVWARPPGGRLWRRCWIWERGR